METMLRNARASQEEKDAKNQVNIAQISTNTYRIEREMLSRSGKSIFAFTRRCMITARFSHNAQMNVE